MSKEVHDLKLRVEKLEDEYSERQAGREVFKEIGILVGLLLWASLTIGLVVKVFGL